MLVWRVLFPLLAQMLFVLSVCFLTVPVQFLLKFLLLVYVASTRTATRPRPPLPVLCRLTVTDNKHKREPQDTKIRQREQDEGLECKN